MLNIHHKSWYIKIIFSIDGEYYLVTRQLTQGKSKESCTSQQFHISASDTFLWLLHTKDILQHDVDIQSLLEKNNIWLEEISYKNESDLQQTLGTILPPREVFTSTMFLLQESKNIFELQPAERIEILKNVFDLMSIDEAKDRIADRRREVQLQRKILWDTQHGDAKLRIALTWLIQSYKELSWHEQWTSLAPYADTIREWEHIADKITLEQCSIPDTLDTMHETIASQLKMYQAQQQSYQQTVQYMQENIQKIQQQIQTTNNDITTAKQQIQEISQRIAQANIPDTKVLRSELSTIINEQDAIQNTINISQYNSIVESLELDISHNTNPLVYAHDVITACIQHGKLLAQEIKNHTDIITNLKDRYDSYSKQLSALEMKEWTEASLQLNQEISRTIERINGQKNILTQQKHTFTQQLEDIQLAIKKIQDRINTIRSDNPDIQACIQEIQQALDIVDTQKIQLIQQIISKYLGDKQIAQLSEELQTLSEKQQTILSDEKYKKIDTEIADLDLKIQKIQSEPQTILQEFFAWLAAKREEIQKNIDALQYHEKLAQEEGYIKNIEQKIHTLKSFLNDIDWKSVESSYTHYQSLDTKKQQIDKQLQAVDALLEQQKEQQKHLDTLTIQIQQREQDNIQRTQEYAQEQKKLETYIQENKTIDPQEIQQREIASKNIEKAYHTIGELVRDHASNQQKLNTLIQEEKLLTNLYQIVAKELLLLVLWESLNILTDIINVYLSQIFSLQLHLEIQKTSGDKVELAAYCEDERGKREVKSLSGWQKTILKLVWMLAISSFLRAPLLFLDETINNIDKDTVGKVADMLTDFVKKQDMKLYTITHSEQIQTMNIWDGVVEITKN